MLLIPAIDLKQGKCVRLLQGQEEEQTIYSDDPVSQALEFQKAGAQRLHLVDLDGALMCIRDREGGSAPLSMLKPNSNWVLIL